MLERRLIAVEGVVQGVGFRPYVHRLATSNGLRGLVRNDPTGVVIDVEGERTQIDDFCRRLTTVPPRLAAISGVRVQCVPPQAYGSFEIAASTAGTVERAGAATPTTPADVGTCDACLAELFDPANRRYRHPFVTCTDCGPRFTIVRATPYDRERTTMAAFAMCDDCRREYEDPADRRFHAEAIACHACGPQIRSFVRRDEPSFGEVALAAAIDAIQRGLIVAIKALGGYHLACDATAEEAVLRLRARKRRPAKPLALMVRDAHAAESLCFLSTEERRLLESAARPIVLLDRRRDADVAVAVAPGQRTLGVMLPSTPLHHLVLAALDRPLVMTSGNRSDEPVVIDDDRAVDVLSDIVDRFLTHDRAIAARADDSVVRVASGERRVVRRSRGWTPTSIALHGPRSATVLAMGGHLKNAICLATNGRAMLSAHVGDLETAESRVALRNAVSTTIRTLGIEPNAIAYDSHPEYASTFVAHALAGDLEITQRVAVQHHHAHVAACIAEHGARGPVIGVAFDGTGLGTDGAIWGGEFLIVREAAFTRLGHLGYVALPGGDAAIRRPWRSAAAHQAAAGMTGAVPPGIDDTEWRGVQQLLGRAETPQTSSVGRLFDAVASLLGVCQVARFEGEAAMAVEGMANPRVTRRYPVTISGNAPWTIEPRDIIRGVIEDRGSGISAADIAGAFHLTLCDAIVAGCGRIRESTGLDVVALSGGVFMNVLLLTSAKDALESRGFEVAVPRDVPCNDGGLALGQAYVAAHALAEDICA